MRDQLDIENYLTLDEDDEPATAQTEAKVFLARQPLPTIIDEVKKAPTLFYAVKLMVDKKRIPGQ